MRLPPGKLPPGTTTNTYNGKLQVTTGPTNNFDFRIGTFDFFSFPSVRIIANQAP